MSTITLFASPPTVLGRQHVVLGPEHGTGSSSEFGGESLRARARTRTSSRPRARPCARVVMQLDKLPRPERSGPLQPLREFLAGVRRATGLSDGSAAADFDLDRDALFTDTTEAPLVLVVGATGRTGRIVVRKLVLRGYRVRVLVRDLYISTLDVVGTGVEVMKGILEDYDSLFEAATDVDKVVCCAGCQEGEMEFNGVATLIRALQDARVADFGAGEATKRTLFHFGEQKQLARWSAMPGETETESQPRAPVGTLMGDELDIEPEDEFEMNPMMNPGTDRPPRVSFRRTASGRTAFMGQVFTKYSGFAEVRCAPSKFELSRFAGFILRCVGDGKRYTMVVRTLDGAQAGVEYATTFSTQKNKWASVRLPLSSFTARPITSRAGAAGSAGPRADAGAADTPDLSRDSIRQLALQYAKPTESPEKDDGRFYLGVDYLKAYRQKDEPDFVLLSCATVSRRDWAAVAAAEAVAAEAVAGPGVETGGREVRDHTAWKYATEKRLRQSGLTYTIVRPGMFTDQPGGNKAFILEQGGSVSGAGAISRADVAEICVRALLDPRACNVTFDAFESMYAPTATIPTQDVSSMLSRLQPNT